MRLKDLEVYRISREMSKIAWGVYKDLKKEFKFSIGQQFLSAIDSIGANIAEGFGRFHYLDSVKFYYNARGSFWEATHWEELLLERNLISENVDKKLLEKFEIFGIKINNFISSIKRKASDNK